MRIAKLVLMVIGDSIMNGRHVDRVYSWILAIATVFVAVQCLIAAVLGRFHVR